MPSCTHVARLGLPLRQLGFLVVLVVGRSGVRIGLYDCNSLMIRCYCSFIGRTTFDVGLYSTVIHRRQVLVKFSHVTFNYAYAHRRSLSGGEAAEFATGAYLGGFT